MNPFRWKREHLVAWAIVSLMGALLGVMLGFIRSPSFSLLQSWHLLIPWLALPRFYWHWAALGFLITGAVFYAVQLPRQSN